MLKFLDAFSPRWNISLFHYRAQVRIPEICYFKNDISPVQFRLHLFFSFGLLKGETGANVLVGIQVAESEMDEFRDRAHNLGYEYAVEENNRAFKLLMY